MKVAQLRERMALLGGTALLAVAIFGAIARRQLRRSWKSRPARKRPTDAARLEPPPEGSRGERSPEAGPGSGPVSPD